MSDNESASKPAVLIATPCFGGLLAQGYVESVIDLIHYAGRTGFGIDLALLGHDALITRCRNTLVAAFLDLPQLTHLMFIDADIKFRPEAFARLLSFDEEVVAGFYPLKIQNWDHIESNRAIFGETVEQSALSYVGALCEGDELEVRGDFATAVYAGTGFLLIRRSAFEKIIAAYPDLKYNAIHAYPPPPKASDNQYTFFDAFIEPKSGVYLSEDFGFCHRWRGIGGKIWLDTRSQLTHIGGQSFVGDVSRRLESVRTGEIPS